MKKSAREDAKADKEAPVLRVAMTASSAKVADGDLPVFDYLASLPQPQRAIAERVDALAAKVLPKLERSVKWGMVYYGVDGGFCFSSSAFVGHLKLMFICGANLKPEPPMAPIGMGKSTRGVELRSFDDLDETQIATWMEQASTMPFYSAARKKSRCAQSHEAAGQGPSCQPATFCFGDFIYLLLTKNPLPESSNRQILTR